MIITICSRVFYDYNPIVLVTIYSGLTKYIYEILFLHVCTYIYL